VVDKLEGILDSLLLDTSHSGTSKAKAAVTALSSSHRGLLWRKWKPTGVRTALAKMHSEQLPETFKNLLASTIQSLRSQDLTAADREHSWSVLGEQLQEGAGCGKRQQVEAYKSCRRSSAPW